MAVYQMETVVFSVYLPGRNIPGFPSVPSNLGEETEEMRLRKVETPASTLFQLMNQTVK